MGRSVSYPRDTLILTFTDYETGREITAEDVAEGLADEDQIGDWQADEFAFDDMLEDFVETCKSEWPSLSDDDTWLDREDHALLSNNLVRFGMSEYCGLIAYWVVARDDIRDDWGGYDKTGLAVRWASQIETKFKERFGRLAKLGPMSNGEGVYQRIA